MMKILRNCIFVNILFVSFFLSSSIQHIYAVSTKMWINTNRSDFAKGNLQNISIHGRGQFTLSPDKQRIKEIPAAYVWCLAAGGIDSIFAGTGDPGSIFKIIRGGKIVEFYKTPELHVQTIAIDNAGNIYAGTLPHGRIYKITPDGIGEVFCELPDPYVWAIIFDGNGNLYAATGNNGIIYKISDEGIPTVFFDSPYSNILDLVVDDNGNIYAACEPEGLVYKITTNGNASVLYDADENEIHCLAIDRNGILYAGTSSGVPPVLHSPTPTPPEAQLPLLMEELSDESSTAWLDYILSDTNMNNIKQPSTKEDYVGEEIKEKPITAERNSVYRIDKDGRVREIFAVQKSFILCLTVDGNNDVFVGTGNKAKLFKINNNEEASLLYEFCESQVLDILLYKDGSKYMVTGNNANIYQLSNEYSNEGTYESTVHDTSYISTWGCISWKGKMPSQTEIKLSTRSGNNRKPDITWSDWSQEYQLNSEKIKSPSARFIQYRATLTTNNSETTPALDNVSIAYLPQNQPPIIRSIGISTPKHFSDDDLNSYDSPNRSLYSNGQAHRPVQKRKQYSTDNIFRAGNLAGSRKNKSNYVHVVHELKKLISWEADDPNDDRLQFDLEYKSVDENKWKELRRNIKEENEYYWNTNRIPDGYYQAKVIACDILDNPMECALKDEEVSDTFLVDNTRPAILNLKTSIDPNSLDLHGRPGHTLIISGVAKDEMCNITDIQYSINSGDWQTAFPKDNIFDSKEESFLLKIPYISSEEHSVVINAVDAEDNIGSSRIVFNP